ncbi:hypothetical protein glysoja_019975 [Glycine soja]|nr:hypothetical protein glysoja_019975 [Glycine soja]
MDVKVAEVTTFSGGSTRKDWEKTTQQVSFGCVSGTAEPLDFCFVNDDAPQNNHFGGFLFLQHFKFSF